MRALAPFLLLVVLASTMVSAQPTSGISVVVHRIDLAETEDGLDVQEELALLVSNTAAFDGNVTLRVPTAAEGFEGAILVNNSYEPIASGNVVREDPPSATGQPLVRIRLEDSPQQANASLQVRLAYMVPGARAYASSLYDGTDSLVVFMTPGEDSIVLPIGLGDPIAVGDGRYHVEVEDAPSGFHVAVAFQPVVSGFADLTKYVWALAGLAVGLFAMYVVVKQGWISIGRTKRFEKGGATESRTMLEARRRTLMAALKDLEVAHDAKEIPDEAYAPLKEEYKVQAVRVMRSLEEKSEPPKE